MVMLCDVQIENQQSVYSPGQKISGNVVLTLEERVLLKALYLKCSGYANVHWEKPQKNKPALEYTNREDYLSTLNYFIGSEEALPKIVERGIYRYKFSMSLPERSPSNYESDIANIRYMLQVFMDVSVDKHTIYSLSLNVQKTYDLRTHPELMQAQDFEFNEHRPFMRFWYHPLQLNVNIPQSGYIPGEHVSVHVMLPYSSQLTVRDIIYKLDMISTYTGMYKNKSEVKVVRQSLQEKVHSLMSAQISTEMLQHLDTLLVPPTAPSSMPGDCPFIRIAYEVVVLVTTVKKNRFVQATLPITVGHISLRSNLRMMPTEMTGSAPALNVTPLTNPYGTMASGSRAQVEIVATSTGTLQKSAQLSRSVEQLDDKRRYVDDANGSQAAGGSSMPPRYSAAVANGATSSAASKQAEAEATQPDSDELASSSSSVTGSSTSATSAAATAQSRKEIEAELATAAAARVHSRKEAEAAASGPNY